MLKKTVLFKLFSKQSLTFVFVILLTFFFYSCTKKFLPTNEIKVPEKVVIEKEEIKPAIVFTLNKEQITENEFNMYLNSYVNIDSTNLEKVINEIIEEQLFIAEAKALNFDKDSELIEEVTTYKNILAQDYKVDSSLINQLSQEAYQRLKSEIKARHIWISVPPFASEEVDKKALEKITLLQNRILNGEGFENIAKEYSDDKKTSENGGKMGWYSALQLLYPLESGIYQTKVGEISEPIKTKFGYHLLKVDAKRESQGRVIVQHILKSLPTNASNDDKNKQKNAIDSLYNLIQNGASFNEICLKNSDDYRNKENGGELPEFWIGSREESIFEEAAFALKEGEISAPIETSSGWEILKMKQRKPLPSYAFLKDEINRKVTTDSRGEFIAAQNLEKAKNELNYRPNQSIIEQTLQLGNVDLLERKWQIPTQSPIYGSFLFSIDGISCAVKEYFDYVFEEQKYVKIEQNTTEKSLMKQFYSEFEKKKIEISATKNITKISDDFKNQIQLFENNLLINRLLEERILKKSVTDTLGQKKLYNQSLQQLRVPAFANCLILETTDSLDFIRFKNILEEGKPYRLRRGIRPIEFSKNMWDLNEIEKNRLLSLILLLKKYPNYIVEIGGHADMNEADNVSYERIRQVVQFLSQNGLPITRIRELDYGKTQPISKFDWMQNQRISFQFFSNDLKDVSKIFIESSFKINQKNILKDELLSQPFLKWEKGEYIEKNNEIFKVVLVQNIEEERAKTFKEAKPEIINKYQEILKTQLRKELKEKYTIQQNSTLIKTLLEKKLNQ